MQLCPVFADLVTFFYNTSKVCMELTKFAYMYQDT